MKKKLLMLASVLFLSVILVACGRGDISEDLVGSTWAWNMDADWTYTFHADGTGMRGPDGATPFEWSISGRTLRIDCSVSMFGFSTDRWDVSIEGDTLTLESRQSDVTYRFNRQ